MVGRQQNMRNAARKGKFDLSMEQRRFSELKDYRFEKGKKFWILALTTHNVTSEKTSRKGIDGKKGIMRKSEQGEREI